MFDNRKVESSMAAMAPGSSSSEYTVPLSVSTRMPTVEVEGSLSGPDEGRITPRSRNCWGRSVQRKIDAGSWQMGGVHLFISTMQLSLRTGQEVQFASSQVSPCPACTIPSPQNVQSLRQGFPQS